jgi:hypothetical protein
MKRAVFGSEDPTAFLLTKMLEDLECGFTLIDPTSLLAARSSRCCLGTEIKNRN